MERDAKLPELTPEQMAALAQKVAEEIKIEELRRKRSNNQNLLKKVREKYVGRSNSEEGLLHKHFHPFNSWRIWENARKMACTICGVDGRSKQLTVEQCEQVERVADYLCAAAIKVKEIEINYRKKA